MPNVTIQLNSSRGLYETFSVSSCIQGYDEKYPLKGSGCSELESIEDALFTYFMEKQNMEFSDALIKAIDTAEELMKTANLVRN